MYKHGLTRTSKFPKIYMTYGLGSLESVCSFAGSARGLPPPGNIKRHSRVLRTSARRVKGLIWKPNGTTEGIGWVKRLPNEAVDEVPGLAGKVDNSDGSTTTGCRLPSI